MKNCVSREAMKRFSVKDSLEGSGNPVKGVTTFTPMWRKVMNSLRKKCVSDGNSPALHRRITLRPFTLNYASPRGLSDAVTPYHFDPARQLNVLSDGRPAVSDPDLLLAVGTTTSTAGSATHFDD